MCLGGNDNSAICDLGNTDWQSLRVLDLTSALPSQENFTVEGLGPQALCSSLQLFGQQLHHLVARRKVHEITNVMPNPQDWPLKTSLDLIVKADARVLQSLADGFWPAKSVKLVGFPAALDSVVAQFVACRWPAIYMESLCLSNMTAVLGGNLLCGLGSGDWPALKSLDLSSNHLTTEFVPSLVEGNPLLQRLDLHDNDLDQAGAQQLVNGK